MNRWPSQHEDLICKWIIKKKRKARTTEKNEAEEEALAALT